MGNTLSSSTKRCGLCYFDLPSNSKSVKTEVTRNFVRKDADRINIEARKEPFDARLSYTRKDIDDKNARLDFKTTWTTLRASIARGCVGCHAIDQLLQMSAKDDQVIIDEHSIQNEIIIYWSAGLKRQEKWGAHTKNGLLTITIVVDVSARRRPLPYEVFDPSKSSHIPWEFKFDIDYQGPNSSYSHPYAYWPPMSFGNTGSPESVAKIRGWLKSCDNDHKFCKPPKTNLPDRVLELLPSTGGRVLVRLVEKLGITDPYACLSHRWGPSTINYRTLKGNLKQQKDTIPWGNLPKTFQDAATITANLGIKYLWIDSLCIVQDDPKDWEVQAAKMCDIYQGAYVTLAASCSADSMDGLFRVSPHFDLSMNARDQSPYTMRRIPEHPTWDQEGIIQMSDELPIVSRAWVYQERLLSARMVHFTRYELFYECSEPVEGLCECQNAPGGTWTGASGHGAGLGDSTNYRKSNHAAALRETDPTAIRRYWHQIVQEYSGYEISFVSDRLPALAGIARQYGTAQPELGRYIAGMWENTLLYDIMWYCPQTRRLPRPRNVHFPSWSWISVGNYVHINSGAPRVYPEDLELLNFNVQPTGLDIYGAITDGSSLELEGYLAKGALVLVEKYGELYPGFKGLSGEPLSFCSDYPLMEPGDGHLDVDTEIFCMRTGFVFGGNHLCMILRRTSDAKSTYERIGMIDKASRNWLDLAFMSFKSREKVILV